MGCEEEEEEEEEVIRSSIKLPLLSILKSQHITNSPERSGMLTPPLHASGSVPFRWEDEPGKPKPCNSDHLIPLVAENNNNNNSQRRLELPPRLVLVELAGNNNNGNLVSPTTVLDGPYLMSKSSRFHSSSTSSSFRMVGGQCYGRSFRASPLASPPPPPHDHGATTHYDDDNDNDYVREFHLMKKNNTTRKIKRVGSFSLLLSHSKSHFWGSIYQGLKQVIVPWRGRKQKKDGFMIN